MYVRACIHASMHVCVHSFVYVCVCILAFYACVHACARLLHAYECMNACMQVCVRMRVHACMRAPVGVRSCSRAWMSAYTQWCMEPTYACVWDFVMSVRVCARISMPMYLLNGCVWPHTCMRMCMRESVYVYVFGCQRTCMHVVLHWYSRLGMHV